MTELERFLLALVEKLSQSGIPYMVAGSYGSSFHGEPRATNDLDMHLRKWARELAVESKLDELLGRQQD